MSEIPSLKKCNYGLPSFEGICSYDDGYSSSKTKPHVVKIS